MNTMWAILGNDGELVCWRGSRGVPFMSPNRRLVEDTLRDLDVIDDPGPAEIIEITAITDGSTTVVIGQQRVLTRLVPAT